MNRFFIYFILIVALLAHLTILNHIKILGAKPDIILIIVVFVGLFFGSGRGLEVGIIAGFLEDLFSLDIFGINSLVLAITGVLAGILNTKFFKESKIMQFWLVASCTIFSMVLHSTFRGSFEHFGNFVIPTGVYTGVVSIPIFSRLIDIYHFREDEELL